MGIEKPLGKPKNKKKYKKQMWRPLGVKNHWENKNPKTTKMWRPMGVKSHWGKKQQENQDVETNGGEKPLGKSKKIK